eukprot:g4644.t1
MIANRGLVFSAVVAATLICAAAAVDERVTMEAGVAPHEPKLSSWVKLHRAPADHALRLHVALKIDEEPRRTLEETFWAVSDPKNPRYGKHLSLSDITELLAVPEERVERVKAFFLANGASAVEVAPNKDMLVVNIAASDAEKALQTDIHVFQHSERNEISIVRASSAYSLPAEVASEVLMVGELLQFPRLKSASLEFDETVKGSGNWPNSCSSAACSGLVQPAVLSERYHLNGSTAGANAKGNSMAVAEFQGQYFSPSDNKQFGDACHVDVDVAAVIGGNAPSSPGVEAQLDIEYIKAVAPGVPLTVIYSAEYSLLNWVNEISKNETSPLVHSVSYGNDEKQQSGSEYMETCNTAFMKAGTRGLSILFASGDQGVCGREGCGLGIFHKKRFKPDFPGGSPYVTVVGGTNFLGDSVGDEEAWQMGGGGFSDEFPIPDFQAAAVAAYKARSDANLPPSYLYNNTGRGYPDIAALGGTKTPYCIVSGGRFGGVAGTSAACPVAAGVFARLNGIRLQKGKSPLGYLNPFIYQNAGAFQDVKAGVNNDGQQYGFTATENWDPATGVGTPNFEALSKLV